jgi:hypothetical protein
MKKKEEYKQWYCAEVEIFHTHIFICIGSREDLVKTGLSALTNAGFTSDCVNDIGMSLTARIPNIYEHINCGECFCVPTTESGTVHFIRLDDFNQHCLDDITILAHECLHVAINIMDTCGIEEVGNRECLCYLHEMIFKNFLKEMSKVKVDNEKR